MQPSNRLRGAGLALVCLLILGLMPVLSAGRPSGADALSFALATSLVQLLSSLPLAIFEWRNKRLTRQTRPARPFPLGSRVTLTFTGMIFGVTTFLYVDAADRAGPVSLAVALQAYPFFAMLWEALFLGRRKSAPELLATVVMALVLVHLATGGSWWIDALSPAFLLALAIPFLWSVAHVILRQVLTRTPITPNAVTLSRLVVSTIFLAVAVAFSGRTGAFLELVATPGLALFAVALGVAYYFELIFWFEAVRHIEVSLGSAITVPAPALTMLLAAAFLGTHIEHDQVLAMLAIFLCLGILVYAGSRATRTQGSADLK